MRSKGDGRVKQSRGYCCSLQPKLFLGPKCLPAGHGRESRFPCIYALGACPRSHPLKEAPRVIERLDLHDIAHLDAKNIDERDLTETGLGLPHGCHVITIRDVAHCVNVVEGRQENSQEASHMIATPDGLPCERTIVGDALGQRCLRQILVFHAFQECRGSGNVWSHAPYLPVEIICLRELRIWWN